MSHGKYSGVVDIAVNGVDEVIRLKAELADDKATIARLEAELVAIKDAARAVVERWHTPLWKNVAATAEYIYALAKAIGEKK